MDWGLISIAVAVVISLFFMSRRNGPKSTGYDTAVLRSLMLYEKDPELHRDHLAPKMLPLHIRAMLHFKFLRKYLHSRNSPGLFPLIAARTIWYDSYIQDQISCGVKQIVMLGAAMDTRALRFEKEMKEKGIKVFELDLPAFIETKKKQLASIFGGIPSHLSLIPIDFTSQSLQDVLQNGYSTTKKTAFLWEGVTMYLKREDINEVLKFVQKHPNSSISFDYVNKELLQVPSKFYGGVETYNATKKVGEKYKTGFNPVKIGQFGKDHGLTLIKHLYAQEVMEVIKNEEWAARHPPFDFVGFVIFETQ